MENVCDLTISISMISLSANFSCKTVNPMWLGTYLFIPESAEFLNLGIILFGSDHSLLLGAILWIVEAQQHP